jgi:hypothetical protein
MIGEGNAIDLGDGRVAVAEMDDWDRPSVRVMRLEDYERMLRVRKERTERERRETTEAIKRKNAKRDRMRAKLSPAAFALWERRQTLDYWLRKTWTSEAIEKQFYAESPLLTLLDS